MVLIMETDGGVRTRRFGVKGPSRQPQFPNPSILNSTHLLLESTSLHNKGTELVPNEASEFISRDCKTFLSLREKFAYAAANFLADWATLYRYKM